MPKAIVLGTLLLLTGCRSVRREDLLPNPPSTDKFGLQVNRDTKECYLNGWDSSYFCVGMASEIADEYVRHHPESIQ